jgi:hypothetical protein
LGTIGRFIGPRRTARRVAGLFSFAIAKRRLAADVRGGLGGVRLRSLVRVRWCLHADTPMSRHSIQRRDITLWILIGDGAKHFLAIGRKNDINRILFDSELPGELRQFRNVGTDPDEIDANGTDRLRARENISIHRHARPTVIIPEVD